MNVLNQLEPQQRRSLRVLFITGLLFWISIAILLPTLPAYLDAIGINQQQIGLIIGAFAIGLLLTRLVVGKLVDTRGRKLVLLIGTAVAAIAPVGYLCVTSTPLLMLIRAFHGISIAAFTTAFSALVVDLAPPKQRGEVIGLMSLTNPLGIAIGPAIGGFLQVYGMYREIFWISIITGAISFIAANQLHQPRIEVELDHNESKRISIWQILTNPALGIPALVLLLVGFPFGAIHTFVPLYIKTLNVGFNPGLFYTIAAIASFSARSVIGSRSDRYGRGIFIAGSLCCYTAGVACLATANSQMSFVFAALLEGLGSGTLLPMTVALVSDRSLPHQRGQVLSICITGLDLGIAIAAPVFGSIANDVGFAGIFTIGTAMAATAIGVFLIWGNRNLRHSIGFCLGRDRDVYRKG
ncbi:MFS transporter [Chamaesiphon minutus]|uniref:Arabinose efflux permease family protein n=1 Tax=Chamaesiphon minutus (strain ATCC 27169 / PCC 6605) TaxID=1173020 RepID=K9UF55_CHAP6|nr:MFS transporter [Chamaesiphon minutus]AFY93752.1 arabinose efflux permease family protein [Chamaesiphon minutus PCC 6605]